MAEQEGPPNDGATPPSMGGGIKANLKKHWILYVVGIGGAVLVMLYIANQSNTATGTTAIDTTGANSNLYGTGVANAGTDPSTDSLLQGLTSVEASNANILQGLANTGATTNTDIWPQIPDPGAVGDPGVSKNSFVYTIKNGDTYASLTKAAGWSNSRPDFLENYSGNQSIFSAMGINGPADVNKPLTAGYKLRL